MTARPDLAALARGFIEATRESCFRWACPEYIALRDAVLSEPAADGDLEAEVKLRLQHELTIDALRAQLAAAAPLFEAAHEYAVADALFVVHGGWRSSGRRAAAMRALKDAATAFDNSEAGQRWKRESKP